MKILVIGGTGLVGSHLLPLLIEERHEVLALTRSRGKLEPIAKLGANGVLGDILEPGSFATSLKGVEMIVLLAMPGITPGHRVNRKRKEELRNETNAFFRNSMELADKFDAPIILPGGIAFRTSGDELADETWPIRRIGLTEIGADTDVMVEDAFRTGRPRAIQLLYGKIYGNGGLFRFMFEMMRDGRFKVFGKGANFIPNIHAADAASAIVLAIKTKPVGEKIAVVDDTPVTQRDFTYFMADGMKVPRPGSVPDFVIKTVIGKDMFEVIKTNCKVSNRKAKDVLGWRPRFPSYREGLEFTIPEMMAKTPYFAGD